MALFSIIMPLYNKPHTVVRAIRSIQKQTLTDWKLFVIDDGSSDNSPDLVRQISDSRIELIHQDNQGPGNARNTGLARADSEYVAFLDSDDEWYPWYLQNVRDAFETKDVGLIGTRYREIPQIRNIDAFYVRNRICEGVYSLTGSEDPRWAALLTPFFSCWNSAVRLSVVKRYGGFYDKPGCLYGEDTPFFLRILFNERFQIIGPIGACYHIGDSDLCKPETPHPLPPFLQNPDLVLSSCPAEKKSLMRGVLDYYALKTIRHWARHGRKSQALDLLGQFPGCRAFQPEYAQCRRELAISPLLPYWHGLKQRVGPPVRLYFNSWLVRLGIRPPTLSPSEYDSSHEHR